MNIKGYFGIGIENAKTVHNIGCLYRSAHALGADFIFMIGTRYKRQASDTTFALKHIPFYEHKDFQSFYENMPKNCRLIGVEISGTSRPITNYIHPERAIYLLGAEDSGLSKVSRAACHDMIEIPSKFCLNVATAGSIIMYDRNLKATTNDQTR